MDETCFSNYGRNEIPRTRYIAYFKYGTYLILILFGRSFYRNLHFMQDAELSQAMETKIRSPSLIYQKVETPIYCFTYTKVNVKKTQLNVARQYVTSLSPKERLLILENVLLILVLIIKSLSIKTTKFTKFFFSHRSIGLKMHLLGRKGFWQKHHLLGFSKLL